MHTWWKSILTQDKLERRSRIILEIDIGLIRE
jgi:hypothetical protein